MLRQAAPVPHRRDEGEEGQEGGGALGRSVMQGDGLRRPWIDLDGYNAIAAEFNK